MYNKHRVKRVWYYLWQWNEETHKNQSHHRMQATAVCYTAEWTYHYRSNNCGLLQAVIGYRRTLLGTAAHYWVPQNTIGYCRTLLGTAEHLFVITFFLIQLKSVKGSTSYIHNLNWNIHHNVSKDVQITHVFPVCSSSMSLYFNTISVPTWKHLWILPSPFVWNWFFL